MSTGQLSGGTHAGAPSALYAPLPQAVQLPLPKERYRPAAQGAGTPAQSKPAGHEKQLVVPGKLKVPGAQSAQAETLAATVGVKVPDGQGLHAPPP